MSRTDGATRASLADVIDGWATAAPERPAIIDAAGVMRFGHYARASDTLAGQLGALGLERGARVAVLLPDGRDVHVAFVGLEKAGLVALGIGPRAGPAEIEHLLRVSGAEALLSRARHRDLDLAAHFVAWRGQGLPLRHHLVPDGPLGSEGALRCDGTELSTAREAPREARLRTDELFLLNSTSGTTGLPKCVCHDQARWLAFHRLALETGRLTRDDVFMSVVPAPFGFGIWTSHVTPAVLGAPVVVCESFDPEVTLECLARHRVSVLAAVSTQFILLLEAEGSTAADWSSLRALYTGGEAVPFERAAEFEERTGAAVLQFYGSNETGALSGTRLDDSREKRLRTSGRIVPGMQVRLFDTAGRDVTETGRGEPACKGPTLSRGYYADPSANSELWLDDGWMRIGDIVEIDSEGYLTVVGRTGDFIIRGGKNVSGPAVEQAVAAHPAVTLAAAVAMPDRVFGERVCVYVELRPGAALTLEALVEEMLARGISKESLPERLEIVEALPRGSGGKIAKQQLREAIRRRVEAEVGS